jgi:hypothetical protein
MRNNRLILALLLASSPALADQLIESYVARLSANDHFNSSGGRLTSPALIIRQDRANFHKFGLRDPEDQDDNFFQNANNRELLQQFLDRGRTTPSAYRMIVNGQPLIRVNVYRMRGGDYVDVDVIGK